MKKLSKKQAKKIVGGGFPWLDKDKASTSDKQQQIHFLKSQKTCTESLCPTCMN